MKDLLLSCQGIFQRDGDLYVNNSHFSEPVSFKVVDLTSRSPFVFNFYTLLVVVQCLEILRRST